VLQVAGDLWLGAAAGNGVRRRRRPGLYLEKLLVRREAGDERRWGGRGDYGRSAARGEHIQKLHLMVLQKFLSPLRLSFLFFSLPKFPLIFLILRC
jgi:hypothetical protein